MAGRLDQLGGGLVSWVDAAVTGAVTAVFRGLQQDWGNALWTAFSKLFLTPTAVINDPNVLRINALLVALSVTVMPIMTVAAVLRYKLDLATGTNTVPPETLVKRCVLAGLAVMGAPTIAWAGGYLADAMIEAIGNFGIDMNLIQTFFLLPSSPGLSIVLLSLIFLVGAAILMIQKFYLIGEFTLLLAMGPVMGISLLRNEQQGAFQNWLREVFSILLTPVLQLLITWFFITKFASASNINPLDFFLSFAYLLLLFKIPRWARTWMYSGGGGDALMAGGQAVSRMVVIRSMMKAVGKGG